jgi:acyl carrier protein
MNNSKLINAFANALSIAKEKVTDTLKYQEIPEWDSVSHMILIAELEDVFEIFIDTEDVIDISSYVKAKEVLAKYNIKF